MSTSQALPTSDLYKDPVSGTVYDYSVPGSAQAVGVAGPWTLTSGETLTATFDTGAGTITFHAFAAIFRGSGATWALLGVSSNLHMHIGSVAVTLNFLGSELDESTYLARLQAQLAAAGALATAADDGTGQILMTSVQQGTGAFFTFDSADPGLQVALGFLAFTNNPGTGNVQNIRAVQFAEYVPLATSAFMGVGAAGGVGIGIPLASSLTRGAGASVTMSGTARAAMGFDTATHTAPTYDPISLATARRIAALMGPGAGNAPDGALMSALVRGLGGGVATVNETVQRALSQAFVGEATDLLDALEAEWGLPNGSGMTTAQRQARLVAQVRANVGGTPQNILAAVQTLAPEATLRENTAAAVATTNPRGVFLFALVLSDTDAENSHLVAQVESLLDAMKPAHTGDAITNSVGFYTDDDPTPSWTDLTVLDT